MIGVIRQIQAMVPQRLSDGFCLGCSLGPLERRQRMWSLSGFVVGAGGRDVPDRLEGRC